MALSFIQRFGTNAALDVSTPAAPKLIIDLSNLENTANGGDIADGRGLNDASTITALTKDANADKIIAALFVLWTQKQPAENNDNTVGVYLTYNFKNYETRNEIEQAYYQYSANFYVPDPLANLDPDDVVTA